MRPNQLGAGRPTRRGHIRESHQRLLLPRMIALLRSSAAVVVGYLTFAAPSFALFRITGQDPHAPAAFSFMALSTLGGMVFAGIGGFVASAIAGRRPIAHALATALLLALGATASLVQTLDQRGAVWSQVAALALMAPCAIVGGWLSSRRHTT